MMIFEFSSLLSFLFSGTWWLLAASLSPLIKAARMKYKVPLKIFFLTHISKEHKENVSWVNADYKTTWSKTLPEDGQRVKPKHMWWNDPSCKPCTPLQTNGTRNVVFLHLPGVALTHCFPLSISSFPGLCVFLLNSGSCYAFQKTNKKQAEN